MIVFYAPHIWIMSKYIFFSELNIKKNDLKLIIFLYASNITWIHIYINVGNIWGNWNFIFDFLLSTRSWTEIEHWAQNHTKFETIIKNEKHRNNCTKKLVIKLGGER